MASHMVGVVDKHDLEKHGRYPTAGYRSDDEAIKDGLRIGLIV